VVSPLKRLTGAPIEVISLAGVISGNTGAMEIEHLYHLVGKQDRVEKVGPIMFPGRWLVFFLSDWNRAKRRGKFSFIPLGPVGHNGVDGPFSEQEFLPDGRTNLRQTLDMVTGILLKDWTLTGFNPEKLKPSNYEIYQQGIFSDYNYYPVDQSVDSTLYQPIGTWLGRLILPTQEQRQVTKGVFFEVYHADADYQHLLGQTVILRWSEYPEVQAYVQRVTQNVHFTEQVTTSKKQGNIHPDRINHWHHVDPLESLTGARPKDDVIVKLPEPLEIENNDGNFVIKIDRDPIQISGRFYGLVSIIQHLGNDLFKVCHYNRISRNFDAAEETVYIPSVIADREGVFPSSNLQIENSAINEKGWYIYGAKNGDGTFVVQAIAPYHLLSLSLDRVIFGEKATLDYINHEYWRDVTDDKGQISTVLLYPKVSSTPYFLEQKLDLEIEAINQWKEGDRALLMHVFGGIGGKNPEFTPLGIYFGHFAYGIAKVIREPLSQELCFDIEYRQIYAHNNTAIIAGNNSWIRYTGDRQWGFLGYRPISDILVKFSPLTEDYDFDGCKFSPLDRIIHELDTMAARYRVGDGTGTTFVGPLNSCVQDSQEALYHSLKRTIADLESNPNYVRWLRENPEHPQTKRFLQLINLVQSLSSELIPLGIVRPDWQDDRPTLGSFPIENPADTILKTLASWRSLLPRLANDRVAMIFLRLGASLWVQRTNQVGGLNPDIEPLAPTDFGNEVPEIKTPFSN
ncbi:MAG: CAAX protease, partial [Mastigocoleus sp. MO_167.B18]|nr:CAAX protease [Mastigocoleus sp. MO_167.B18]